jgi:hypothetical protein
MNPVTYLKFFIGNLSSQFTRQDDYKSLEQLLIEAKQYWDPVLPRNADADTRLESVAVDGTHLVMNNTLFTVSKEELDPDAFAGALKPVLVAEARRRKRLSRILAKGGTLVYRYVDMNGLPVTDIKIPA